MAHIVTKYNADGTVTREAQGYGGTLCKKAMEPYLRRQGDYNGQDTAEALEPARIENQEEQKLGS